MEQYFRTRASVDDEPDLAHNRRANDARLKSRFEHIFAKYGKDFEEVGDEIDLETGEIVVNNGHLESMRHEVDPGKTVSSQVLQVLEGSAHTRRNASTPTVGFVNESSTDESGDEEGASAAGTSGYSSSNDNIHEGDNRRLRAAAGAPVQRLSVSNEARDDSRPRMEQGNVALREENAGNTDNAPRIDRTSHPTSRGRSTGAAPMDLSFLQDSMEAVLTRPGQHESIDPNVIQALGQSIASQLARFMSNPSKKRKSESLSRRRTHDSRWEYPGLPGDRTARTPSPPPPASSSAALFARSPNDEDSIWAAERPRRPKRQRTSLGTTGAADPGTGDDERDDEPLTNHSHASARRSDNNGDNETTNRKICSHCGDTESRQWRNGPDGRLCNACGTYFFRYGRPRPFDASRCASKPGPSQTSPGVSRMHRASVGSIDEYSIPLTSTPGTNGYAANTARRMTGDARYARFTAREEDAIIKLRAVDQRDWESIGQLVSNRTASSVQCHYRKLRRKSDFEDRLRVLAQATSNTPALSERIHTDTPTSNQVGRAAPSQNSSAKSASRSISVLQKEPSPTTDVDTPNGPTRPNGNEGLGSRPRFSESEKQLLIRLREGNMEWTQIATYLPGRTLNSLKAMDRRLTLAQESPGSDAMLSDEFVQADQPPVTTEEDELIIMMRDQQGMSFAEMTAYFAGRAEADLVLRYEHLKTTEPVSTHGEPASVNMASNTLGAGPALRQYMQRKLDSALEGGESRNMMPPPPRPSPQCTSIDAYVKDADQRTAPVAHKYNSPVPQTPSFPNPPLSHPPRRLEVGPSAWAATQPTSKGPLPFKPARRSLIPLVPRAPLYTISDPFVSDPNSVGVNQTSLSENVSSNTRHRPSRHAKDRARASLKDLYEAFPTSTESSSQNHEELVVSTVAATQEYSAKDTHDIPAEGGNELVSPAVRAQAHTSHLAPESKHGVPYSEEESKLVKRLKEQGLSYSKIAAQVPGRTPISIQNHYYYTYTSTVKNSKAQSSPAAAKRTSFSPPLLRKALDNSTRRSSMGPDAIPRVIDTALKYLHENDSRTIGTSTDGLPKQTEVRDFAYTTMQDDEPLGSLEAGVTSDDDSEYQGRRLDVLARFQAFDDRMGSETTGACKVITSGRVDDHVLPSAPPEVVSSGLEPDHGLTRPRRKGSSLCVYIDNAARCEDDPHKLRITSLDQSAVHGELVTSQALEPSAAIAPVELGISQDRPNSRGVLPPPAKTRRIDDESLSNLPGEGTVLTPEKDQPDAAAQEVNKSQQVNLSPQSGTRRKQSLGRPKRASTLEVADSDSDTAHNPSSQEKSDDHGIDEERATEARAVSAKRGRGRPRRSISTTDGVEVSKSGICSNEPHAPVTVAEVINISSDPSIKPEATSESNSTTTTAQPTKLSNKPQQQSTPRSKISRYSDSALFQRPSAALATPARSGSSNPHFLSRSGTSSMSRTRLESLSRTGTRGSPVTRDSSGTRRFILATAAGEDGEDEEIDELS